MSVEQLSRQRGEIQPPSVTSHRIVSLCVVCRSTIYPESDAVVCYVMTRSDFSRAFGNMRDILAGTVATRQPRISSFQQIRVNYGLNELEMLNVLGYVGVVGGSSICALDGETFLTLFDELSCKSF